MKKIVQQRIIKLPTTLNKNWLVRAGKKWNVDRDEIGVYFIHARINNINKKSKTWLYLL